MEELTYEYDWRHPIEVPNPNNKSGKSVEKSSFKWFQYWLKHECTFKQIANYFGVAESTIRNIAKLFKWKERKRNKEDYESRQREKLQQERYQEFIDEDYKNSKQMLLGIYNLIEMAFIVLNVLPNINPKNGSMKHNIPEDFTVKYAIDIIKTYPKSARTVHAQVLRDLEKAERINDTQSYNISGEMDLNQTIKDADNTASIDDLFKLYDNEVEDNSNGNETK